jgi:hypothetical protein
MGVRFVRDNMELFESSQSALMQAVKVSCRFVDRVPKGVDPSDPTLQLPWSGRAKGLPIRQPLLIPVVGEAGIEPTTPGLEERVVTAAPPGVTQVSH